MRSSSQRFARCIVIAGALLAFAPAAYADPDILVDINAATAPKVEAGSVASFTVTLTKDGGATATDEWFQSTNWVYSGSQSAFSATDHIAKFIRVTDETGDAGGKVSCAAQLNGFRCDIAAGYAGTTSVTFTQEMPRAYVPQSPAFSTGHTDGITMPETMDQITRFTVEKGGPSSLSIDVAPGFPTDKVTKAADFSTPTIPKFDLITSALLITNRGSGTAHYADLIWDSSITPLPSPDCVSSAPFGGVSGSGAMIASPGGLGRCELPPIAPGATLTIPATFDPNMYRSDVIKLAGTSTFKAEIGGKADAGRDEIRVRAANGTWSTVSSASTAVLEYGLLTELTTPGAPPTSTLPPVVRPIARPVIPAFKLPKLGAAIKAGIATPVACFRLCTIKTQLLIPKATMRSLGLKSNLIGAGKAKSNNAGRARVITQLNPAAKRSLVDRDVIRGTLKVVTVEGGRTTTITRPITLRR